MMMFHGHHAKSWWFDGSLVQDNIKSFDNCYCEIMFKK